MGIRKSIDREINIEIPLWENCPRFEFCNVNKCPLHPDFKKLKVQPEDKEKKCLLGKTRRKRILKWYPIKKQGSLHTTKEINLKTPRTPQIKVISTNSQLNKQEDK